jgi:hypothetical protein
MPAGRFAKFDSRGAKFSFAAAHPSAIVMACVIPATSAVSFYRRWRRHHPCDCRHERDSRPRCRADKVMARTKPMPTSSHAEHAGKIRAAPKTGRAHACEKTPASERARKRAMGKIRREVLIKRREAYFDLLVSGYSVESDCEPHKEVPLGSSPRRRSGLGEATARCA